MIELKNISYAYPNQSQALSDVSLRVEQGEAIALIGANGSGKSTLMKLINGLILADSGEYLFHGTAINAKKLKDKKFARQFHKKVGFIFQNPDTQLFCSSVHDEIAFGLNQMGMAESEISQRVKDTMELLQISELSDREPYHLSGGEKKRVAIAAAVALNPEVYVFDEPMNNLDPKTKRFLRQFMIRLNQSGKTIICSTHDFAYVDGIFQQTAVFSASHRLIRVDDYEKVMRDKDFLVEQNII